MITIDQMIDTIKKGYNNTIPEDMIKSFVLKMVKNNNVVFKQEGFAFYLKVDDKTIERIAKEPGYILNQDNLLKILQSTGDNVHFFGVLSTINEDASKAIFKGLNEVIEKEKPRTVSWWNPAMKKFITRRI